MANSRQGNSRGGPKTAEGKKRSSQNSLKTGAYAKEIVLPQENADDFLWLSDTFMRDLKPQDIVGQTLVRDLVHIAWRQLRLQGAQRLVLSHVLNRSVGEGELAGAQYIGRLDLQLLLEVVAVMTSEHAGQAQKAIAFLDQLVDGPLSLELAQTIWQEHALLFNLLSFGSSRTLFSGAVSSAEELFTQCIETYDEVLMNFAIRCRFARGQLELIVWLVPRKQEVLAEYEQLKRQRTLEFMERPNNNRAHDDLRRSFAKVMSEYRKHEEWRSERALLEMPQALLG